MIALSIVIVNWNTRDLLRDCLESILDDLAHKIEFEIIVVDNASADGSAAMVRDDFPDVRLIENDENAGFVRANNQAVKLASGQYILLLNSDTKMLGSGAEEILQYLDDNPKVGIATGKMLYEDGDFQSSYSRFPNIVGDVITHTLRRVFAFKPPFHRYFTYANLNPDEAHEVDWLCGAYLYVRRELLQDGKVFDEALFMYYEDTLLCKRAWDLGYKVVYLPKAPIVHYHNRSAKKIVALAALYSFQSSVVYYE